MGMHECFWNCKIWNFTMKSAFLERLRLQKIYRCKISKKLTLLTLGNNWKLLLIFLSRILLGIRYRLTLAWRLPRRFRVMKNIWICYFIIFWRICTSIRSRIRLAVLKFVGKMRKISLFRLKIWRNRRLISSLWILFWNLLSCKAKTRLLLRKSDSLYAKMFLPLLVLLIS